jgi:membrane-associated phospholipid phosphatase
MRQTVDPLRILHAVNALFLVAILTCASTVYAQEAPGQSADGTDSTDPDTQTPQSLPDPSVHRSPTRTLVKQFLGEEVKMWASPFHVQRADAKWLFPLAAGAAALLATDRSVSNEVRETDDLNRPSGIISSAGGVPIFVAPITLMAFGQFKHNDKVLETGQLSLRAVSHAGLIVQVLKLVSERQRPDQGRGLGAFWGGGSSFPSGHSMSAWAFAAVMAHQYPENRWLKVGSYSFATAVSLSRIGGLNHYPSDVLVGSSMGYLIGRYVVRHHNPAGNE